jgi:hypothetical protein
LRSTCVIAATTIGVGLLIWLVIAFLLRYRQTRALKIFIY